MLLTHITNKQKEITLLLYRFRFLNRLHIQTLLKHKTPITINNWLKDLTQKQYLNKIFKRSWTENSVTTKYYIGKQGIRFLKTQPQCPKEYLRKLYREKDRSKAFIDRCLFIADIYIKFVTDPKSHKVNDKFYTPSDYAPASIIREIKPDFGILTKKNRQDHYNLYQLFPEGTPRYAVRKRIEQYMTFLTEGAGSDMPTSLYLITQTEKLCTYLIRHVQKILQDESIDVLVYVSTYNQVSEHGIQKKIFTDTAEVND